MNISKRLFEIASLAPKSAIGLAVKLLAEEQSRDEKRRQGQRDRTKKCMAKKALKERDPNVSLTLKETVLYTIASTELQKESKLQPRSRGSRLSADWKPSLEDRQFALDASFTGNQIDEEALSFVDYWIAVPGNRGLKTNWSATWRNRIRDQAKRQKSNKPKSREKINATLDHIDAVFSDHAATNSRTLASPANLPVSINIQRSNGASYSGNGIDIHPIPRKHIEGDLLPLDRDACQF